MRASHVGAALAAVLAAGLAAHVCAQSEPLTLRYETDAGLTVPYRFSVEGEIAISLMGQTQKERIRISGSHVDRITSVQGNQRALERRIRELQAEVAGESQQIPSGASTEAETFVLDHLGRVVSRAGGAKTTAPSGAPGLSPTQLTPASFVFIPFCEPPVKVGESWDNSRSLQLIGEDLDVQATTTLVATYESAGMEVALTQTVLTASGTVAMPDVPGAPGPLPAISLSLKGAVLQSSRIEDGCLLGVKMTMDGKATISVPGGPGTMAVELQGLSGSLQVAES